MFPSHAIKAAEREFPCRCDEGYTGRDLIDPDCRCDDLRHALEAAWEAMNSLGYTVAFVSRCWCEGKAEGSEHTPGCAGIEQDRLLGRT